LQRTDNKKILKNVKGGKDIKSGKGIKGGKNIRNKKGVKSGKRNGKGKGLNAKLFLFSYSVAPLD